MVGHHARFAPPMLKMKQEMESGALGRICNVLVTCCSSSGLEQKEGDWRAEPGANPGGPLLHCGIHLIDILLSFFGEVATVSAIMQEDVTSYEAIDNTLTLLHFKNGVQAAFVCNYTTAYMHTFDVFGTKGNLHHHQHITDLKQHELYFQPRKNGPHEPWEELEIPQDKDAGPRLSKYGASHRCAADRRSGGGESPVGEAGEGLKWGNRDETINPGGAGRTAFCRVCAAPGYASRELCAGWKLGGPVQSRGRRVFPRMVVARGCIFGRRRGGPAAGKCHRGRNPEQRERIQWHRRRDDLGMVRRCPG